MPSPESPRPGWPDERLIAACLNGDELAWGALVDKYKAFVYAIVRRSGILNEDAGDVFQAVWLDVYNDLDKLKKKGSLRSWITSVSLHRCYHWKRRRQKDASVLVEHDNPEELANRTEMPSWIEPLEREQWVREAIAQLPDRCQDLIHQLFFTDPPRPYSEVAESLGLATGSIGFIRGRCLKKLAKLLAREGAE